MLIIALARQDSPLFYRAAASLLNATWPRVEHIVSIGAAQCVGLFISWRGCQGPWARGGTNNHECESTRVASIAHGRLSGSDSGKSHFHILWPGTDPRPASRLSHPPPRRPVHNESSEDHAGAEDDRATSRATDNHHHRVSGCMTHTQDKE
jgi:hypothetical protein